MWIVWFNESGSEGQISGEFIVSEGENPESSSGSANNPPSEEESVFDFFNNEPTQTFTLTLRFRFRNTPIVPQIILFVDLLKELSKEPIFMDDRIHIVQQVKYGRTSIINFAFSFDFRVGICLFLIIVQSDDPCNAYTSILIALVGVILRQIIR